MSIWLLGLLFGFSLPLKAETIDIYNHAELLDLIHTDRYLEQVKADDCQLVQDIEARAEILKQPLYQFLWGEMLNFGVCVLAAPARGIALLQAAAKQGSPEAMVQLAKYYQHGRFVVQNKDRATQYVLPAAATGNQTAKMMLARLMAQGYGSPRDYMTAYHWLFNEVFSDPQTKQEALILLQGLEAKMPMSVVNKARQASITRH